MVVGRKAEGEYKIVGVVDDVHHPRTTVPNRVALFSDHSASECDSLSTCLRNAGEFGAFVVRYVFAVDYMESSEA